MTYINTEIPRKTLLFLEHGMSQSMAFRCKTLTSRHLRPWQYLCFKLQVGKNFAVLRPYKYPMKNCRRTTKFFPTWGLYQRYFPGL